MRKLHIILIVLAVVLIASPILLIAGSRLKSIGEIEINKCGKVELTGYIIETLGEDRYLFRDNSGQIEVEITCQVLKSMDIQPERKVTILGEIIEHDKDADKVMIKVSRIKCATKEV